MAILWTFHARALCRHVYRELMRSAVLNVTPIISATACHQRNYVERYSRSMREILDPVSLESLRPLFTSVLRQVQRGKALEAMAFLDGHS